MFTGPEIAAQFADLGITHVIWIPDTTTGPWESALESSSGFDLIRICREGEAWPLAAGLHVGGQSPIILIQTTGLFESGDAVRNVLFDLRVPLFAVIGARNWLNADSTDSAKRFTEPILKAWGIPYALIDGPEHKHRLADHYRQCVQSQEAGFVLLAE